MGKLIDLLSKIETKAEMKNFIDGLLTPREREEFEKRIQIIQLLDKNIPQREIADMLGVGIATITRGSKEIQKGNFKTITDDK